MFTQCPSENKIKSNQLNAVLQDLHDRHAQPEINFCYHSGAITNLVLILAPTTMLNGEGKPTTPIQHFKRHMYSPDDDDVEERESDTVTVQLKGTKVIIPLPSGLIPLELGKKTHNVVFEYIIFVKTLNVIVD